MTYGENSRELRDTLAWLLGRRRILYRLSSPETRAAGSNAELAERQRAGQIILRYRSSVLTWCLQATVATMPKTDLRGTSKSAPTPTEDLRLRLSQAVDHADHGARLLDLLATGHGNELLNAWQRLARAAALGEHDFFAGVNLGALAPAQAHTVLRDVTDVTRGLLILDERYNNVPGWRHVPEAERLGRSAESVTSLLQATSMDLSVDASGWQPSGHLHGPAPIGVAGAVHMRHNALTALTHVPNALNMRRLLLAQAQISHQAVRHAAAATPELEDAFSARATMYRTLVRASRDLVGVIGGGGRAVIGSQNAASRLRRTHACSDAGGDVHALHQALLRSDARLATIITQGFIEGWYLTPTGSPHLMDEATGGVHRAGQGWGPATSVEATPLWRLATTQLRPRPPQSPLPGEGSSGESRAAYRTVMTQELARVRHPYHR